MRVIEKYELAQTKQTFTFPRGYKIVHCEAVIDTFLLKVGVWVLFDQLENQKVNVRLWLQESGSPFVGLGSHVQAIKSGDYVWHLFVEDLEP